MKLGPGSQRAGQCRIGAHRRKNHDPRDPAGCRGLDRRWQPRARQSDAVTDHGGAPDRGAQTRFRQLQQYGDAAARTGAGAGGGDADRGAAARGAHSVDDSRPRLDRDAPDAGGAFHHGQHAARARTARQRGPAAGGVEAAVLPEHARKSATRSSDEFRPEHKSGMFGGVSLNSDNQPVAQVELAGRGRLLQLALATRWPAGGVPSAQGGELVPVSRR